MDPAALLRCFAGTLEKQPEVRTDAEAQLRTYAASPGFLCACLDIVAASDAPAHCRTAAAVYFKNRVVRCWRDAKRMDGDEKPVLRERLVPVMCSVDWPTKHRLLPVLRVMIASDYPKTWVQLLGDVGALLRQQDDLGALYTGLVCFAEICRLYRWIDNEERLGAMDPVVAEVFPHLLAVGNAVLDSELTEVLADVLKHILKCYKFVTYYDLPAVLQTKEALVAWAELHCRVVSTAAPAYAQQDGATQTARCYKWAVANVERLFRRYASKSLSSKFVYDEFKTRFVTDVLPHVMSIYLAAMEKWCRGERWLPKQAVYHLLEFLSHCVTQRESWKTLKPCFENIVAHFIFPLLCPSEETLELFSTDPVEYINAKMDSFDDSEPDVAALGLLVTLATKRTKSTVGALVAFACGQLQALAQQPEDVDAARKKDGALRFVGGISHLLTRRDSPYYAQSAALLTDVLLPNLASPHEFLVARTLDVCARFADAPVEDPPALAVLFDGILHPLAGNARASLPVVLQAALGVQAYIHHALFQEQLARVVVPIMLRLLELSNAIDNEAVSMVMQECVEKFSAQLQPFGADLMKSLVAQFLRLAAEVKDAVGAGTEGNEPDAFTDDAADKVVAAIGLLNTMITVLLSFENSRDVCMRLEETFAPAVEYVLVHELDDFLAEIGELMENSVFLLRSVTPVMWVLFARLLRSFFDGVALMYTDELFACVKNFVVYGADHLAANPDLVASVVALAQLMSTSDDDAHDAGNDVAQALELAQTLVLSLQRHAQSVIPVLCLAFVPVVARTLPDTSHVKTSAVVVHSINFVVACLVHGPADTLAQLEQQHYERVFFELWFALIPRLRRAYDLKVSILGLFSLANHAEMLLAVPGGAAAVGMCLVHLFRELPTAIRNLEKQRQEFDAGQYDYDPDAYCAGVYEEADSDYEDTPEPPVDASETTCAAPKHDSGFFTSSDHEDSVQEDFLGLSSLDDMDPFAMFKDFSLSLQADNPALYGAVFGGLSDEDRQIFVDIFAVQSRGVDR